MTKVTFKSVSIDLTKRFDALSLLALIALDVATFFTGEITFFFGAILAFFAVFFIELVYEKKEKGRFGKAFTDAFVGAIIVGIPLPILSVFLGVVKFLPSTQKFLPDFGVK